MLPTDDIIVKTFVNVDDNCKKNDFLKNKKCSNTTQKPRICKCSSNKRKPYKLRKDTLCESEIITIIILYQLSQLKNLKEFYKDVYIRETLPEYFPKMPSYNRFLVLKMKVDSSLIRLIQKLFGDKTGIYYIDSTSLPAGKIQRVGIHKTFKDIAKIGKTSRGWFFGFKVHFVINNKKEIVGFRITDGSSHDNASIINLIKRLKDKGGKLIGDRGYICKKEMIEELENKYHIKLITKLRKNMKIKQEDNLSEEDKRLLGKRNIVETVIGEIKRITNITTIRIKSISNYIVNILSSIAAYQLKIKLKLK